MKFTKISVFFSVLLFVSGCSDYAKIEDLVQKGEFAQAGRIIDRKMNEKEKLLLSEIEKLQKQKYDIQSVKIEYNLTYDDVYERLKSYIPDLSDVDMENWTNDYSLEYYVIEGERKYYYNCIFDLFQVNINASKRAKIEEKKGYDASLYPSETIKKIKSDSSYSRIIKIALRYFQDLGTVPNYAVMKAWIPFVRTNSLQTDVRIIHSSIEDFNIPNDTNLTSMIHFQHEVVKENSSSSAWEKFFTNPDKNWIKPMKKLPFVNDTTFIFQFLYSYKSKASYRSIEADSIEPYRKTDRNFIKYTRETVDNQFTPFLKDLSKDIIGNETNSYLKARLIYQWICESIIWTDPKSVLGDYADYTARYKRGDCSAKSNLFISLCRINGIPAREQGGWTVTPNGKHAQHTWAQVYFENFGWLPVDVTIGAHLINHEEEDLKYFYFGNSTPYHMIIYDEKPDFIPEKKYNCIYGGGSQLGAFEWEKGDLEPYIQFDSFIE